MFNATNDQPQPGIDSTPFSAKVSTGDEWDVTALKLRLHGFIPIAVKLLLKRMKDNPMLSRQLLSIYLSWSPENVEETNFTAIDIDKRGGGEFYTASAQMTK